MIEEEARVSGADLAVEPTVGMYRRYFQDKIKMLHEQLSEHSQTRGYNKYTVETLERIATYAYSCFMHPAPEAWNRDYAALAKGFKTLAEPDVQSDLAWQLMQEFLLDLIPNSFNAHKVGRFDFDFFSRSLCEYLLIGCMVVAADAPLHNQHFLHLPAGPLLDLRRISGYIPRPLSVLIDGHSLEITLCQSFAIAKHQPMVSESGVWDIVEILSIPQAND